VNFTSYKLQKQFTMITTVPNFLMLLLIYHTKKTYRIDRKIVYNGDLRFLKNQFIQTLSDYDLGSFVFKTTLMR